MIILDIRVAGKRKREVVVSLEDSTTLELTPETYRIFSQYLKKDQSLDDNTLSDIRQQDQIVRAKAALNRFLSYRARSAEECRRMLIRKGFPQEIAGETVARYLDLKLIDTDKGFAERLIHDRILMKPEGRSRLLARLAEKGIKKPVAMATVSRLYPPEKELALAIEIARRKSQKIDPNRRDVRKGLLSFLNYRGFDYQIVQKVMAELDL